MKGPGPIVASRAGDGRGAVGGGRRGGSRRDCLRQAVGCCGAALLASTGVPTRAAEPAGFELSDWPRGQPTPNLEAPDLQGRRVRLPDLRGRAVLLNFWASWCEPCRTEMPSLQMLTPILGEERLAVLAVNFKEPAGTVLRYVRQTGLTLPVLFDPDGALARAWDVRVFPSTVLIDPRGRARQRVRGGVDWSGAEALRWVDRLLAA